MLSGARHLAGKLVAAARRGRPDPDVDPDANPLYAHRCFAGKVERWHPVPAADAPGEAAGLADSIFQPSGFVSVDGCVFDLREEGVYRFYRLPRLSEQRIVWHGDLDSLLSMLSYLWVYGNDDDPLETEAALAAAHRRVIVASCTLLARLAIAVLEAGRITARPVALISLDAWGGQDDGHTLVEVRSSEEGWFLYDPSLHLCIVENGRRLCLVDAVGSLKRRRAALERLTGNAGHGLFRAHGFDHGFWVDERFGSDAILYDWYHRMAGVPLVGDGATYAFPADGLAASDRERLARRYRTVSRDAFLSRYYGASTACVAPSADPAGMTSAVERSSIGARLGRAPQYSVSPGAEPRGLIADIGTMRRLLAGPTKRFADGCEDVIRDLGLTMPCAQGMAVSQQE